MRQRSATWTAQIATKSTSNADFWPARNSVASNHELNGTNMIYSIVYLCVLDEKPLSLLSGELERRQSAGWLRAETQTAQAAHAHSLSHSLRNS